MSQSDIKFAYFGGEPLGLPVLEKLHSFGLVPSLIVCSPDRPVGRKQTLTPPPVKVWAHTAGIEVYQPDSYKNDATREKLKSNVWDVFVVVAYNYLLPSWFLEIPKHGVLNVHPSLLPKLRGASPIRSAILRDEPEAVGVTIMLMDSAMDHGPLLAQQALKIDKKDWPVAGPLLDNKLAIIGGELLATTLPAWITGNIKPTVQEHNQATYCGKFKKSDAELQLDPLHPVKGALAWQNWLKINAFTGIGETHFIHKGKRIKVKQAKLIDNQLHILRVTPEGKSEQAFTTYLSSL